MMLSTWQRYKIYKIIQTRKPLKRNPHLVPRIMAKGYGPDHSGAYQYPIAWRIWLSKFYYERPPSRHDFGGRFRWERHIRLTNGEWYEQV